MTFHSTRPQLLRNLIPSSVPALHLGVGDSLLLLQPGTHNSKCDPFDSSTPTVSPSSHECATTFGLESYYSPVGPPTSPKAVVTPAGANPDTTPTTNSLFTAAAAVNVNMAFDDQSSLDSASSTLRLTSSTHQPGSTAPLPHPPSEGSLNARTRASFTAAQPVETPAIPDMSVLDGICSSKRTSLPIAPSSSDPPQLNVLKIDAETLARQITLIEMELFAQIKPDEFLSFKWTGREKMQYAANIVASTRWFNQLNYYVRQEILNVSAVKERAEVMAHFIHVAKRLIKHNNLYSAMSIFTALQSHCIHRLKQTFAMLSNKDRAQYRRLQDLFSQENNHQRLRDHTLALKLPCIPYLGLYLTDLTYVHVAHPRQREFESPCRMDKLNNILRVIADFQQSQYTFEVDDVVRRYLLSRSYIEELQCFLDDDLCKRSVQLEPNENPTTGTVEGLSKGVEPTSALGHHHHHHHHHPAPTDSHVGSGSPFRKGLPPTSLTDTLSLQMEPLKPIRSFTISSRPNPTAASLSPQRKTVPTAGGTAHTKLSNSGPNLLDQEQHTLGSSGNEIRGPSLSVSAYESSCHQRASSYRVSRNPISGATTVTGPGAVDSGHSTTTTTSSSNEGTAAWLQHSPFTSVSVTAAHSILAAVKHKALGGGGSSATGKLTQKGHRKTRSVSGPNFRCSGTSGPLCAGCANGTECTNCSVCSGEEILRLHLLDDSLLDDDVSQRRRANNPQQQFLEDETSLVAKAAVAGAVGLTSSSSTLGGSSGVFLCGGGGSSQAASTMASSSGCCLTCGGPTSAHASTRPSGHRTSESGDSVICSTAVEAPPMATSSQLMPPGCGNVLVNHQHQHQPSSSSSSAYLGMERGDIMCCAASIASNSGSSFRSSSHTNSLGPTGNTASSSIASKGSSTAGSLSVSPNQLPSGSSTSMGIPGQERGSVSHNATDLMRMVCQGCLQRKTVWKKGKKPLFHMRHRFWVVLMESSEDAFLVYFEPTTFRACKREEFSYKECQVQRLRDVLLALSERELSLMTSSGGGNGTSSQRQVQEPIPPSPLASPPTDTGIFPGNIMWSESHSSHGGLSPSTSHQSDSLSLANMAIRGGSPALELSSPSSQLPPLPPSHHQRPSLVLGGNNGNFFLYDPHQERAYKMRCSGPLFYGPPVHSGAGAVRSVATGAAYLDWYRLLDHAIHSAAQRRREIEQSAAHDLINLDVEDEEEEVVRCEGGIPLTVDFNLDEGDDESVPPSNRN